jgi:hypothetical protein
MATVGAVATLSEETAEEIQAMATTPARLLLSNFNLQSILKTFSRALKEV